MQCNSCSKKLKLIVDTNTPLYTCENNKCHYYCVIVCNPFSQIDEDIKEIFNQDKKQR